MADKDKISITLDLDSQAATDALKQFNDQLGGLGENNGPADLMSKLTGLLPTLGLVTAAVVVLKKTWETALEGEQLQKAEKLFQNLAQQVGITADEFKNNLNVAAGKFLTQAEQLKLANQSMVMLGANAAKLPEIIEAAKKATALFGGDIVENTRRFTDAIADGRTRQLEAIGIHVQADKALKEYARTNGIAVNEISQFGKQQAILNAVLQTTNERFKSVKSETDSISGSVKSLHVIAENTFNSIAQLLSNTVGPPLKTVLGYLGDMANYVNKKLFPSGAEKSAREIASLKDQIADYDRQIKESEELAKSGSWFVSEEAVNKSIEKLKLLRTAAEAELNGIQAAQAKASSGGATTPGAPAGNSAVVPDIRDLEAAKANQAKFESEMAQLRLQRIDLEIAAAKNQEQLERSIEEKKAELAAQTAAKIKAINEDPNLDPTKRNMLIEQEEMLQAQRTEQLAQQVANTKSQADMQVVQNRIATNTMLLENATSFANYEAALQDQRLKLEQELQLQIAAIRQNATLSAQQQEQQVVAAEQQAAQKRIQLEEQVAAQKQKIGANALKQEGLMKQISLQGYQTQSQSMIAMWGNTHQLMTSFSQNFANNAGQAFQDLGAGTKTVAQAMKAALLGAIADEAIARGMVMMAMSIFPPNPLGFAAGAALVALGGFLKSQAGGHSKLNAGAAGAGAGGLAQVETPKVELEPIKQNKNTFGSSEPNTFQATPAAQAEVQQQELKRRSVTLVVNGNIFETDQTRQRLMDLIRQETDATDFKYQQVGS